MKGIGQSNYTAVNQTSEIRDKLMASGISNDEIDRYLSQAGIEDLLNNNRLMSQYFSTATKGLQQLTTWDYDNLPKALYGMAPSLDSYNYKDFFMPRDTSQGQPYVGYFPAQNLFNSDWMVQNKYMNTRQGEGWKNLMTYGYSGGSAGSGKSMAVGGNPGGGKAMAYGSPTQGKTLEAGGLPPPPPPPPGGATGAGGVPTSGATYSSGERDYLYTIIQDGVVGGWLEMLFDRSDLARDVSAKIIVDMQSHDAEINRLNRIMQGLDPTDPNDAHQIRGITAEIQAIHSTKKEKQDILLRAQHYQNEFVDLVKSIMEIIQRTESDVIRNMRVGG